MARIERKNLAYDEAGSVFENLPPRARQSMKVRSHRKTRLMSNLDEEPNARAYRKPSKRKSKDHCQPLLKQVAVTTEDGVALSTHAFKQWSQCQSRSLPAWARGPYSSRGSITHCLHEEILDYTSYTTAAVQAQRFCLNATLNRVRLAVAELWGGDSCVEEYGSHATGMWLPTSDVDVVITGVGRIMEGMRGTVVADMCRQGYQGWESDRYDQQGEPVSPPGPSGASVDEVQSGSHGCDGSVPLHSRRQVEDRQDPVVSRAVLLHMLHAVATRLSSMPWVASLDVIHRSRVPVIKLVARFALPCTCAARDGDSSSDVECSSSSEGGSNSSTSHGRAAGEEGASRPQGCTCPISSAVSLAVDISISSDGCHSGLSAREYVLLAQRKSPQLRPLVLVLKQFLSERGLNETYTGGLSSYCVVLLAIYFLGLKENIPRLKNLGALLLRFFEFFGGEFNFKKLGICVNRSGVGGNTFRLLCPPCPCFVLEDPFQPGNNVARSSFALYKVIAAFEDAHLTLRYFKPSKFAPTPLSRLLHRSGHTAVLQAFLPIASLLEKSNSWLVKQTPSNSSPSSPSGNSSDSGSTVSGSCYSSGNSSSSVEGEDISSGENGSGGRRSLLENDSPMQARVSNRRDLVVSKCRSEFKKQSPQMIPKKLPTPELTPIACISVDNVLERQPLSCMEVGLSLSSLVIKSPALSGLPHKTDPFEVISLIPPALDLSKNDPSLDEKCNSHEPHVPIFHCAQ